MRGTVEEVFRSLVLEQRFDLFAQRLVAGARLAQKRRALLRVQLEGCFEQAVQSLIEGRSCCLVSAMCARLAPPIPDLSMKPGARFGPLATDSDGREPDHLRDFFQAETTKESQLDDLSFPRVELGQ